MLKCEKNYVTGLMSVDTDKVSPLRSATQAAEPIADPRLFIQASNATSSLTWSSSKQDTGNTLSPIPNKHPASHKNQAAHNPCAVANPSSPPALAGAWDGGGPQS